jgi:hypothetical protein
VAGGKDEAIAVDPLGVLGVVGHLVWVWGGGEAKKNKSINVRIRKRNVA